MNWALALDWEVVASLAAGLATGAAIIGWPRPALICLGLLSLLLGLLGISTLKVMSIPALVAILGGIGLIGLGRLIGAVEQLVEGTSVQSDGNRTMPKHQRPGATPEVKREPGTPDQRVEPRL